MLAARLRLAAIAAVFAAALLASRAPAVFSTSESDAIAAPAPSARPVWLCPPCGDDHCKVEYDKPGRCPVCGMALVSKEELAKAKDRPAASQARAASTERKRAEILVFPGVEIIDFSGPYEILGAAGLEVTTVAEKAGPITTSMGLKITPDFTLQDAPEASVVVVPGGRVVATQESPAVKAWLKERAGKTEVVLSVCNGAFILARAGLLDGVSATTVAPLIDGLRAVAPKTTVVSDKRWVDNGTIVTSAGLSSGIDGALHVVEKLFGRGTAQRVAVNLEYRWDPEGRWVRAQLADRKLLGLYQAANDWDGDLLSHEGTADRWEDRWRLRTKESADRVLASVAGALHVEAKDGRFTLKDENGVAWDGDASTAPDGPGTLLLTVRITKAHV